MQHEIISYVERAVSGFPIDPESLAAGSNPAGGKAMPDGTQASGRKGVRAVAGKAEWRVQSPGAPLPENLFLTVRRHPGVKAAAELAGLRPGYPRKPLRPLPVKDKRAIKGVLGEAGVI